MKADVSLFKHNKSLYVSNSLWMTLKVRRTPPPRSTLDELHEHTMAEREAVILPRALRLFKMGHQRGFDFTAREDAKGQKLAVVWSEREDVRVLTPHSSLLI